MNTRAAYDVPSVSGNPTRGFDQRRLHERIGWLEGQMEGMTSQVETQERRLDRQEARLTVSSN